MVFVRKFSQFIAGTLQEAVGLTSGANTIGPTSSGGAVTQLILQNNHGLVKGNWARVNSSGLYVKAQADTTQDAEVVGVVIDVLSIDSFILQQSGYISTAQAVFTGLIPGNPYFLDPNVAGNMLDTDVIVDGQVSRPVFDADTTTSGWVLPYRGIIAGGGPDTGEGPAPDSNLVPVTQTAHGFSIGNWLRVSTPSGGQVVYVLANADTFADSQCVGVVVNVLNANQFVLQFAGYNQGSVTQDSSMAVLVPSTVYYLSTTAGAITSIDPINTTTGAVSKPLFISEQTTGTVTVNAGYILPQRPIGGASPLSGNVFLGRLNNANNFSSQTILSPQFGAYQIILIPNAPIEASGGGNTNFGFQFYNSIAGWVDDEYFHSLSGVNLTANATTTGVWYGDVNHSGTEFAAFITTAASTVMSLTSFQATLTANAFSFQNLVVDNSIIPLPGGIVYTANGYAAGGNPGSGITIGLRLIVNGGASIVPGSTAYFNIYGIPN